MINSVMRMPVDCEQLVEALGDAIVVADASGAITLWNPAAERLFGFTHAEALGHSLDLLFPSVCGTAIGLVTGKPWRAGRRATVMTCCEFQPCTRTGERCRLPLRSHCWLARSAR